MQNDNTSLDMEYRWLPKSNRDFLVKRYVYDKILMNIQPLFSRDMSQIVENVVCSNVEEESFDKLLHPDPEVDDSQNLISSSFSIDGSLVKFSQRWNQ